MKKGIVLKAVSEEMKAANELMMAPYRHGVNYIKLMDRMEFLANALSWIRLNRSFKNLGLLAA